MRLLELFAGSCAVSQAFAARGWKGVCVDLRFRHAPPIGFDEWITDALNVTADDVTKFDFAWASSPCQEFSVFGMPCFFPSPKYPALGIRLFNHTREIFEESGVPYVMENVRAAQQFVGPAKHRCGSFHLWGNGVPPLMPQGIVKGFRHSGVRKAEWKHDERGGAAAAIIPPELSNCVAEYAERILEGKVR